MADEGAIIEDEAHVPETEPMTANALRGGPAVEPDDNVIRVRVSGVIISACLFITLALYNLALSTVERHVEDDDNGKTAKKVEIGMSVAMILLLAQVFKYVRSDILQLIALLLSAICLLIMPHIKSSAAIITMRGLIGLSTGVIELSCVYRLIDLWRNRCASILMFAYLLTHIMTVTGHHVRFVSRSESIVSHSVSGAILLTATSMPVLLFLTRDKHPRADPQDDVDPGDAIPILTFIEQVLRNICRFLILPVCMIVISLSSAAAADTDSNLLLLLSQKKLFSDSIAVTSVQEVTGIIGLALSTIGVLYIPEIYIVMAAMISLLAGSLLLLIKSTVGAFIAAAFVGLSLRVVAPAMLSLTVKQGNRSMWTTRLLLSLFHAGRFAAFADPSFLMHFNIIVACINSAFLCSAWCVCWRPRT